MSQNVMCRRKSLARVWVDKTLQQVHQIVGNIWLSDECVDTMATCIVKVSIFMVRRLLLIHVCVRRSSQTAIATHPWLRIRNHHK
jgi:hypothetical protein